ncbi:MAG: PQQ-binding-like beta-propeller repeat protein [Acetobacteraceae bacterium]|jgi:DNA-binding beta-propeller fold protein YncE
MRLKRAALALLPLLLLFAAFSPPALAAGLAFVMNSGGASISVVDMATQKELRRIPALREPHHWALTPDGKSLLIGDTVGNELLFLDPTTGAVQRRMPCVDPYQLGFSPNGRFLVVNGIARNQIDVYDGASLQLLKRFPIASMPSHLAYAPDSGTVFVSLQETDRLVAIDLKKLAILWNEPVGKTPAGVLWLNGKVLVADMGTDYLAEVDPADGRVLRHITTGKGAHNLFLSPDGKMLWVNNRAGGTTESLDATTLTPIRTYKIPGGPDDMAFAPDGRIWITRRWAEKVAVLDPATGDYQTIDVGRSPHGIFLNDAARPATKVAFAPAR